MKRWILLLIALVLLVAGVAGAYVWTNSESSPSAGNGGAELYAPLLEARESLLSAPRDVELELSIDIPKGSESDNPDHQEISAEGSVDFAGSEAELVYDFNDLANAAGFLGHFDTMEVIYADGVGYLDVFIDGPPWVSIEPSDASNGDVSRLRELMLTTPMVLPGLLEASATASMGAGGELSREVDPEALAASDDPIASGLGGAFEDLEVDAIEVEVTLGDDGEPAEVVISFHYRPQQGKTTVEATYLLDTAEDEVSVEAPGDSEVRTFSSIFG